MNTLPDSCEDTPESKPYAERFRMHLAANHPDIELSPTGISLVGNNLDFIRDTYGNPSAPTYLQYHNDDHTYGVTQRTLWQLAIWRKAFRTQLTSRDFELAAIAASAHDIVKGPLRVGSQIAIPVEASTLTLANEAAKSDELLSAEYAMRAMSDFTPEERRRVGSAILATEVTFDGAKVSLKHINEVIKDPIAISLMIADTNDIFARSGNITNAISENVSDLSLEMLRNTGSSTIEQIVATTGNLLRYQSEFLRDRRADYMRLAERLHTMYDKTDQYESLRTTFQTMTDTTVSFADQLEKNADNVISHFQTELSHLKDKPIAIAQPHRIRQALARALSSLTTTQESE